jgi:SPW repeat-containing protein
MTAWRRWQDYVTMASGVLLFISPIVFGQTAATVATGTAYLLGILLFLSGILAAAMREARGVELVPAIIAVVTFVSPWVLGFAAVTGVAWSAWVLAIVAFLAAGSQLLVSSRRATAA